MSLLSLAFCLSTVKVSVILLVVVMVVPLFRPISSINRRVISLSISRIFFCVPIVMDWLQLFTVLFVMEAFCPLVVKMVLALLIFLMTLVAVSNAILPRISAISTFLTVLDIRISNFLLCLFDCFEGFFWRFNLIGVIVDGFFGVIEVLDINWIVSFCYFALST